MTTIELNTSKYSNYESLPTIDMDTNSSNTMPTTNTNSGIGPNVSNIENERENTQNRMERIDKMEMSCHYCLIISTTTVITSSLPLFPLTSSSLCTIMIMCFVLDGLKKPCQPIARECATISIRGIDSVCGMNR